MEYRVPGCLAATTTEIIIFAVKDGEALQKQDWELTVVQIMNSLMQNSDLY